MLVKTIQIHWHERQPIYSTDFDPTFPSRLATAGGDNNVRIWRVIPEGEEAGFKGSVQYVTTLSRHVKQVNCVRFSPDGKYLASAGDGGLVILWKQSTSQSAPRSALFGAESEEEDETGEGITENWTPAQHFRSSDMEDVYDLAWSPDSRFVLFGLSDHSIQIWDVTSGQRVKSAKDHSHFVQGVAWDPLGVFIATQSSDRSVKVWRAATKVNGTVNLTSFGKISRAPLSLFGPQSDPQLKEKQHSLFFDETLVSFFRRLAFSPDGSLLFMPTGLVPKMEGRGRHAFYVATRGQLASGLPGLVTDGSMRGIIAVRPHPRLFHLRPTGQAPLFALPYRIVYATASQDSVCVYDTTQSHPIASFSNLHYGTLTDLAWSRDGRYLIVTATDGFASMVSLEEAEMGEMLSESEQEDLIGELRAKYAPGALPKPESMAEPLELTINLQSEAPPAPTSEFDVTVMAVDGGSNAFVPPSSPAAVIPSPPVINILPVKRKPVSTPLAQPPQPPSNCQTVSGVILLLLLGGFAWYFCTQEIGQPVVEPPALSNSLKDRKAKLASIQATAMLPESSPEIICDTVIHVDKRDPERVLRLRYQGQASLAAPTSLNTNEACKALRDAHEDARKTRAANEVINARLEGQKTIQIAEAQYDQWEREGQVRHRMQMESAKIHHDNRMAGLKNEYQEKKRELMAMGSIDSDNDSE